MDLSLLDYRRQVADLYARVRAADDPREAWADWVATRDALFRTHSQTPLDDPADFQGLACFPYDPSWRLVGQFLASDEDPTPVGHSAEGTTAFTRIGHVLFRRGGRDHRLEVLWLPAYGGGVFLPFRDATGGTQTYGGGRYLLDTAKGADLGHDGDQVVLDFNFAYHPSCVHSPRWSCPLAPPANHLDAEVTAGECLAPEP